jgi:helix-turn-helix protein
MGEHYKIGRNQEGLTQQERKIAKLITSPPSFAQVGTSVGVTKQRAYQITQKLIEKGVLIKLGDRYAYRNPTRSSVPAESVNASQTE